MEAGGNPNKKTYILRKFKEFKIERGGFIIMNPEIQFEKSNSDYTGLQVQEMPYGEMENWYGSKQTYYLDVITGLEPAEAAGPVAVFIHGGGFTEPCDKRQAYIPMFAKELVKAGYTVISPDYPIFVNGEDRDRAVEIGMADCCKKPALAVMMVVDYIKNHAEQLHVNPNRLAIFGGSAGGMTAFYAVASRPSAFSAFVNLWGSPAELPNMTGFPPVLTVHGTEDELVPFELEQAAQAALEDAGVSHEMITLKGCGHTPLGEFDRYMPQILKFLEKNVSGCR